MTTAVLQARGVSLSFGRVAALDTVHLTIGRGQRHALIGPNGAGKTSLVNVLAGMSSATAGTVILDGHDVTAAPMSERARRGLVRTFQINQLFPGLTPRQSLALCVCERDGLTPFWWKSLRRQTAVHDEAQAWLERMGLASLADHPVARLPYGHQRLLEIAMALVCRPRVLLLDEPAAGLPEAERLAVLEVLHDLPRDMAVLLIEHDMGLVFRFADTVSVLAHGRILAQGDPAAVRDHPGVRDAYLGPGA